MMSMNEEEIPRYKTIKSYAPNYFRTQDSEHRGAIVLFKDQVIESILPTSVAALCDSHFETWVGYKPELILLGCGDQQIFLRTEQQAIFIQNRISIDSMSTPAACRTFNILMSEERNAMAILFPITI